ncbi:MAG: lysylphosphatidylglycerol synthase domain-containing protein [bacterium]|nr:lysylphosphatidylglycerol synthase domain-containing protein [bacterium]
MKKKVRLFVGTIILIICFFFIIKAFLINLKSINFQELRFNFVFLLISYIVWGIAFSLEAIIWKYTIICFGEKLNFVQAFRIVALAALPKYIPGKIVGMAGQVWLTKEEGVSGGKGSVGVALNTGISILAGFLLTCVIFPFVLKDKISTNIYLLFGFVPLFFVALHPAVFIKVANFFLIKLKRSKIDSVPGYGKILNLLGLHIIFWVLQSIAIFFLIRSFYSIGFSFLVPLCGIFPGASVIALLSFFTPGGLGVREGILSYLFSFFMPISIGIIAAVIMRIWGLVSEMILFAVFAKNIKKYITSSH